MELNELIINSKNGDQESMAILLDMFDPLISKHARLLNYEEAKTDIIIGLIERIQYNDNFCPEGMSEGAVVNYLKTCVMRLRVDLIRKRISKSKLDEISTEDDYSFGSISSFENDLITSTLVECLPRNQKEIIDKIYIQGFKVSEVAHELGVSRQAVNNMKNKALYALKEMINEREEV